MIKSKLSLLLMIFDRALNAGEIQDIYNAQNPAGVGMIEETRLEGLASILSVIQDILEKIKSLF